MDFSPDGKQVAIGAAATTNGLEVAMPLLITDSAQSASKKPIINYIRDAIIGYVFDLIYPVGSIFMSTSNAAPTRGTWTAWGAGRVPVGVDTADSDFNTVQKTGGAKSVSFAHQHNIPFPLGINSGRYQNLHPTAINRYAAWIGGSFPTEVSAYGAGGIDAAAATNVELRYYQTPSLSMSANVQQKYITCYMFRRTA
jgi:hypothetical protein